MNKSKETSLETVLKAVVSLSEQAAELPTRNEFEQIVTDVLEVKSDVREVLKEVKTISKAVDKDAETLVKHDGRITRVERHLAIK